MSTDLLVLLRLQEFSTGKPWRFGLNNTLFLHEGLRRISSISTKKTKYNKMAESISKKVGFQKKLDGFNAAPTLGEEF